jgi:peptidoglycan/LPS O-acetylase OafA/YrhL
LGTATLTFISLGVQSPQDVYWTLVYEQQFYLVMAILILPIFRRSRVWLIIASSLIAVGHTVGILSNRLINDTLPNHWLEFELGILVYLILQRRLSYRVSVPVFIALFVAGMSLNYRTQAASAFALFILLFNRLDAVTVSVKFLSPLRWLGLISYSFYLVHLPVFALSDLIFLSMLPQDSLLLYFSGILSALIIATVFYLLFERPFMHSGSEKRTPSERLQTLAVAD